MSPRPKTKKWLIRTESFHLLGPISKDKLKELIQNNAISENDEICSGNGYWFHFNEKDLVERYINQDEAQSFNEVSEALNEFLKRELEQRQSDLANGSLAKPELNDTKVINLSDVMSPDFEVEASNQKMITSDKDDDFAAFKDSRRKNDEKEDEKATYQDLKLKRVGNAAVKKKISQKTILRVSLVFAFLLLFFLVIYHSKVFEVFRSYAYAQNVQTSYQTDLSIVSLGPYRFKYSLNILGTQMVLSSPVMVSHVECSSLEGKELKALNKVAKDFYLSSPDKCWSQNKTLNLKSKKKSQKA